MQRQQKQKQPSSESCRQIFLFDRHVLFQKIKTKQRNFGLRIHFTWSFAASLKAAAAKTLFSQFLKVTAYSAIFLIPETTYKSTNSRKENLR